MAAIIQPIGNFAKLENNYVNKMSMDEFHLKIGHKSKDEMVRVANRLNLKLEGDLTECLHCARAKIIRTRIPKDRPKEIVEPGIRFAIDITGCSVASFGGNKYVNVKIDFGSGKKWEHS